MLFLMFVAGAFVTSFEIFPYKLVFKDAFAYLHAVKERREIEDNAELDEMAAVGEPRVTVPAKPGASDGYTFMTSSASRPSTAILLDMDGKIVHRWHRNFREIWPVAPHRKDPSPDSAISWRYGEMFANGDIIVVLKAHGDTPDGYGLAKLDKDSNLIWAVADNFHHHFCVAADGRIFGTTHQWRDTAKLPLAEAPQLPGNVLEDFVVVVSPEGKEIQRVSLLEAMAAPDYAHYLRSAFGKSDKMPWDPIHPNDVEIITPAFAEKHSWMKPGMVMVSLRDLDLLIVLDMDTGKIVRAIRSVWKQQHDPDLLANGDVLLFDNRGHLGDGGASRIVEFDPSRGQINWAYIGSKDHPFFTRRAGGQELTPNGNVLIAEDESGRLFEVTRQGEIVWEYLDPGVRHATRLEKAFVQFPLNGASK